MGHKVSSPNVVLPSHQRVVALVEVAEGPELDVASDVDCDLILLRVLMTMTIFRRLWAYSAAPHFAQRTF